MSKKEQVEKWLQNNLYDILYDQHAPRCEQYDFSYLDMLGWIIVEKYGIEEGINKEAELNNLLGTAGFSRGINKEREDKFKELGIKHENYSPQKSTDEFKTLQEYKIPKSWEQAKDKTIQDGNAEIINNLQAEYSLKSIRKPYSGISRPETGDMWSERIKKWIGLGMIDTEMPAMSIGCRWADEIKYFRSLGLKNLFGLDLFSEDGNLIKIGDVHNLGYADSSFSFAYQRNTFDKLFDIRQAFGEVVRVLADNGIFIYDDVISHTQGLNELVRSSPSCVEWILQHLKARDINFEVLFKNQVECNAPWCRYVAQLAVQIKK